MQATQGVQKVEGHSQAPSPEQLLRSVSAEGRPAGLVRFGRGEGLWEAGGDWAVVRLAC